MITVQNMHSYIQLPNETAIIVDRSTPVGNPYRGPTRETAIETYRHWLKEKIELDQNVRAFLKTIIDLHMNNKNVVLLCHCPPKPCHADVIKEICDEIKAAFLESCVD